MITLTLDKSISAKLKGVFLRWRRDIKSAHRSQAIACGAGFRTHEALCATLAFSTPVINPEPTAFWDFLSSRGYDVDRNLIHRMFASIAVEAVAARYPRLTSVGFGTGEYYRGEPPALRKERFKDRRDELLTADFAEAFLLSHVLIQRIPKTKTVRRDAHSYKLKHIAENLVCSYPDGSPLGPSYVQNGAFIAAADYNGFIVHEWASRDGTERLNANFNMPKRVVDDLDAECRPDGPVGELRAEQAWRRQRLL